MAQGVMKMNSEEMEMTMVMMENEKKTTKKNSENTERKKRDDVRIVEWERFLPRMAMRVLLVEADDSTRQIVTALLRKSSYRVTSVSDGLKAWETLKGGPHNIDLILTEVDLPSISGFALLTLIMEHEICKSIPVIMMSSEDSISTVYKCMLRGAADYLVKPLRRNELKTLWQHVWRRQSSTLGANVMEDESVGQQKVETTPQDAASDDSSSNLAGVKRNEDYIEKGSDEQSSCTKPDFGATSAQMEDLQDSSDQLCGKSLPNDVEMQKHGTLISDDRRILMHERETGGSEVATSKVVDARANLAKDVEPESERRDVPRDVPVTSSREAIDFVGTFNNHNFSLNNGENKFDSCPRLDLSLRSQPSGFEDEAAMKKFTLIQSDASAFTRYTNKPLHSTLTSFPNQKKEFGTDSEKILSNIKSNCVNSTPAAAKLRTERSINSKATYPLKQSEGEASLHQNKVWPVPVPPESVRLNNVFSGYSSVVPHIFGAQSSLSPVPNSSSANQQEPAIRANAMRQPYLENGTCVYDQLGETAGSCTNRSLQKVDHQKFDSIEDRGRISPTTDQSGSSSFCNGALSRLSSMGYGSASGSNSNVDQAAVGRNEEGFPQSSNRSIQREAALTKFRLKRKDRCYEKKVRYESRKKLAEQRPRVKGQFVRQVQSDSAPASYDNPSSNGADG